MTNSNQLYVGVIHCYDLAGTRSRKYH